MSKVPLSCVVSKTVGGGTPARDNREYWNGSIPWATVKDFRDGDYKLNSTEETITPKGLQSSASNLIESGTPIICTRMAVGRIAIADFAVAINQDLRALYINADYDAKYVLFSVDMIRNRIENLAIGSTVKGIHVEHLLAFEILDIPKPEQAKIAEVLSTVDRAIAQTEALIAKQQRIKAGLMHDLLTRGIDEHGTLRSEETHAFKDSPLGRIPAEWGVVSLADLAEIIDPQPDHRTPPEERDGIPYVGISDFRKDGSIDFAGARKVVVNAFWKQRRAFSIDEGDFIFGKIGTIGLPRRIPSGREYALSANVMLIKPRETPSFVYWWMESPIAARLVDLELHLTSQPAFGIQKIRAFKIPKPSRDERKKIGEMLNTLDLGNKSIESNLSKLRALKTALMQDLLTGTRRVTALLEPEEASV
jgi:type I restriction enzyme S subunit